MNYHSKQPGSSREKYFTNLVLRGGLCSRTGFLWAWAGCTEPSAPFQTFGIRCVFTRSPVTYLHLKASEEMLLDEQFGNYFFMEVKQ